MGLFTPGWLKEHGKAIQKLDKTGSVKDIERILMEPGLYGKNNYVINKALKKLRNHPNKEQARTAMEHVMHDGPNACIRCAMGYYLNNDAGKAAIRDNIVAAYKEKDCMDFADHRYWLSYVENASDLREIFSQLDDSGRLSSISCITNQEFLIDIVLKENRSLAGAALKNLRFDQEQCSRIIKESGDEMFRTEAIKRCTDENKDLLVTLADEGNIDARKRLLEIDAEGYAVKYRDLIDEKTIRNLTLSNEELLTSLAGEGNEEAKKRLVNLDPDRFGVVYPGKLDESKMKIGIEKGIFSDEGLEEIIRFLEDIDERNTRGAIAWKALDRITDKDVLSRLLSMPVKYTFFPSWMREEEQPGNIWRCAIGKKLSGDEDILTAYLLDKKHVHYKPVDSLILQYITADKALLTYALSKNPCALEAAKRLDDRFIGQLRGSESKEVKEYADIKWAGSSVGDLNESQAVERLKALLDHHTDGQLFLKISERLESDEARIEIIKDLMYSSRPFGDNTSTVEEKILKDLTDGEALLELGLNKHIDSMATDRLRELIDGTPLEKKMTDRAVEDLMESPIKGWGNMHFIGRYYNMVAYKAAWKYAGERYIKKLLAIVEDSKEYAEAWDAVHMLQSIYRDVPEISSVMRTSNGTTYVKHDDYVDEHCFGNTRNEQKYITLKL